MKPEPQISACQHHGQRSAPHAAELHHPTAELIQHHGQQRSVQAVCLFDRLKVLTAAETC